MKTITSCGMFKYFILLCLCPLCMMSWAYDFESNGMYYTVNLENLTVTIDACDESIAGEVVVPSLVTLKTRELKVVGINRYAFHNCKLITSVTIPDGIAISENAFSGCTSLKSVTLPSDLKLLSGSDFCGCKNLSSINLPQGLNAIGAYSFYGCESLTGLDIPETVDSIGDGCFENTGIKNIGLPSRLTKLSLSLFANSPLESISVPSCVVEIGDSAFFGTKLQSITLPDGLKVLGKYSLCGTGVKVIDIPGDVSEIKEGTFENCTNLSQISLGKSIKSIGDRAFYKCISLQEIYLPDNVKQVGSDNSDSNVFAECSKLSNVRLPRKVRPSLNFGIFDGCVNLKYLMLPDSLPSLTLNKQINCGIEEFDMTTKNTGTSYQFKYWPKNIKRIAVSNDQRGIDVLLNRVKVMPQAYSCEVYYYWYSSGPSYIYYQGFNSDSLYLCDSYDPIICHAMNENQYVYQRDVGDYYYLYLGRNLYQNSKDQLYNPPHSCSVENFAGYGINTLVIGPLVTELTVDRGDYMSKIESLITSPLQLEPSFPKKVYINATLIVPAGTKSAYEQAPGWKDFFDIQEADVALGISSTSVKDKTEVSEIYNIRGQRILKPEKGINIIKRTDGSTTKVIIK